MVDSIFLLHKDSSEIIILTHFFILRHMSSNLRTAGWNLASWNRSSSVLANRYGHHVLMFWSLDLTKSAVPVEQPVFSTFCYLFRAFLFLLQETSLILLVKMVIYCFFVCQMFRSHWTVSWTKLLSIFLGALAFDMDYVRWQDDHIKQINELRAALNAHANDNDLRHIIDSFMAHYYEAFRLKGVAAKADTIHVPSGMWKTPVERCFYVVRSILTVKETVTLKRGGWIRQLKIVTLNYGLFF